MSSDHNKSPYSNGSQKSYSQKFGEDKNSQQVDQEQSDALPMDKKSRKSSHSQIANMKELSAYLSQDSVERGDMTPKSKQYILDFERFLNKKQIEKQRNNQYDVVEAVQCKEPQDEIKHVQKSPNRQDIIQKELKKRLKLYSKSKEAKFNDMLGVFKKLDTFIDIKPFLHDLNLVNNTKMYNTIQELKHRVAEKKNQEEVEIMLEQVKQKIQKQEKEQEEENKILSRGMKDFVQKTELLQESSQFIMDWRRNHNINQGIMSDPLIDHYRQQNNNYQELVDQNDPDIDTYQFYDHLNKQLFKKKSLFQKVDFSSIDTRRASLALRQEEMRKKHGEEEVQQLDHSNKKNRLQTEVEDISEEEKLRLAEESLKQKLLTIEGFEKENQIFSDQLYFESYQEKAEKIRKNLQKATEATFKKKWANANVKLKKLKEDDYRKVMKKIRDTQQIVQQNLQYPSRESFKIIFQGKEVESQVAKLIKSPNKKSSEKAEKDHEEQRFNRKLQVQQQIQNSYLQGVNRKNSYQAIMRSDSNQSKDTMLQRQIQYQQSPMGSDYSQQDGELDKTNSNESLSSDRSENGEKYYSKKWKQVQNANRLSQRNIQYPAQSSGKARLERQLSKQTTSYNNSITTSPHKQFQKLLLTQTSRTNYDNSTNMNKSHFHLMTTSTNQSIQINNKSLLQAQKNQSFNQTQQVANNANLVQNQHQNQYFFQTTTKTANQNSFQNPSNKSYLYYQKKTPQYHAATTLTSRRNTDVKTQSLQNNNSTSQDFTKQMSKSSRTIQPIKINRSGVHPMINQQLLHTPLSFNNDNKMSNLELKITNLDDIQNQNYKNAHLEDIGINNPPSSPSTRFINTDKLTQSRDIQKKQTESYQAVEKHLLGIKFQKFIKGIDHHQVRFGVTREKYQSKINQIQKKFENEITKFEPPKLDIFKSLELKDDQNPKYTKGKMVNYRSVGNYIN